MRWLSAALEVIKDLPTPSGLDAPLFEALAGFVPLLRLIASGAGARLRACAVERLRARYLAPRVFLGRCFGVASPTAPRLDDVLVGLAVALRAFQIRAS